MMLLSTMNCEPLQLLFLGPGAPDLSTSAWGPFVVHAVVARDELADALGQQQYHAVVLDTAVAGPAAGLADWPVLGIALLASAVLVVTPEPTAPEALALLQLGVQDVLPTRQAQAESLARAVRLAVVRDQLQRAARKAYATDLATGLPNHAQLMEHATHLLALREREPAAMALLALHIEGLPATEARLGAEAANVLRRKVAVRLRAGLRASDVVASVGADTFIVMLAWIDAGADSEFVATKLVQALQRPFTVAGQDVAVAVRVGVARYPEHGKEAAALLGRALALAGDGRVQGRAGLSPRGGAAAANDE
jgi:diguanylate cyclase (GGDEF)-like protein